MERVALFTVEQTFCLRSDGHPERSVLVVHPNLSVPASGWKSRTETVVISRPDGREFEALAEISTSHFNLRDPEVSIDQRWRITVLFHGMTSDDVPDGSRILVSPETREALFPRIVS